MLNIKDFTELMSYNLKPYLRIVSEDDEKKRLEEL
jgi:hypothetical protein